MDKDAYKQYAQARARRSPCIKNCLRAFTVGGGICVCGEAFFTLYRQIGLAEEHASACVTVTLIFLAGLFTGIGWFDKLAKFAGAGTLVPITGFSNAVTSQAIDAKAEGYVTGVAAKMFVIAGPVIVYGSVSSILYGILLFLFSR